MADLVSTSVEISNLRSSCRMHRILGFLFIFSSITVTIIRSKDISSASPTAKIYQFSFTGHRYIYISLVFHSSIKVSSSDLSPIVEPSTIQSRGRTSKTGIEKKTWKILSSFPLNVVVRVSLVSFCAAWKRKVESTNERTCSWKKATTTTTTTTTRCCAARSLAYACAQCE